MGLESYMHLHDLGAQLPGRPRLVGVQRPGSKARKRCEEQSRLLFNGHSTLTMPPVAFVGGRYWDDVKRFPEEFAPAQ